MEEKLITLAVLSYTRAEVLKGRLEAQEIESFIVNQHAIRPTFPEEVRVRIKEKDAPRALPIALHLKEEYAISNDKFEMLASDVELVLVPVDFSDASYNAFEYAYNIASKLEAKLMLLHVYYDASLTPVAAVDSYAYHLTLDIDLQEIENKAKDEMVTFIEHFDKKYNFEQNNTVVDYELVGGATEDSILTAAKQNNADLIVMGTHGVGRPENTFFGSVAATIIEEAEIPVLVAPAGLPFGGFPEPTSVLYATNLETTDYIALRKLMRLLYVFNVKIYCIHVDTNGNFEIDEIRLNSLKDHLQEEYPGYEVECMLHVGTDIVAAIDTTLQQNDISFVALTTHKKTLFDELFHPSLTHKMLQHSTKPLLVFHV